MYETWPEQAMGHRVSGFEWATLWSPGSRSSACLSVTHVCLFEHIICDHDHKRISGPSSVHLKPDITGQRKMFFFSEICAGDLCCSGRI